MWLKTASSTHHLLPSDATFRSEALVNAGGITLQLLEPEALISPTLVFSIPSPAPAAPTPSLTRAAGWIVASLENPATLTGVVITNSGNASPSQVRIKACLQSAWVPLLPVDVFPCPTSNTPISFPPLCASALHLEFGSLSPNGLWQPQPVTQISDLQLSVSTAPGDLSLAISGQAPFWQQSGLLTKPVDLGEALVAACEAALASRNSSGPLTLLLRADLPGSLTIQYSPGTQQRQILTGADLPAWQAIPLCWQPQPSAARGLLPATQLSEAALAAPAHHWQSHGNVQLPLPSDCKLRALSFSLQPKPPQRCLPPPPLADSVAADSFRHFLHASGGEALAQAIDLAADAAGDTLSLLGFDLPLLARSDTASATLALHGDANGHPADVPLHGDPVALAWPGIASQGDANGWFSASLAEPLSVLSGRIWLVLSVIEGSLLWPLFGAAPARCGPCLRRPAAQTWLPLAASAAPNQAAAMRLLLADANADSFPVLKLQLGNVIVSLPVDSDGTVALNESLLQRLNHPMNASAQELTLEASGAIPGPLMLNQLRLEVITPVSSASPAAKT